MLSANQISVFFNRRYPVNGLKSDPDFLHVDRHEWTRQGLVMVFQKKFFQGKWAILDLKMARSHNFGSTLKILHNETGQEVHGIYLNDFPEKNLIWGKWAILAWKWHIVITLNPLWGLFWFLKFCIIKGTKRYMKISLMVFLKKYFGQTGHFGSENVTS